MKKILLMAAVAMMTAINIHAQIPANIKQVLDKCDEKMSNPSGLVMDITLKMKMLIFSGNGTMKWYMKGDKSFMVMTMKALGQEMREESGFDGLQEWQYTTASSKKEKDSLIITKTTVAKNNDYGINIDYEKSYKKAKMKEKGLYYEIDFSDRIDPELPKKMSVKIAKDSYFLREISTSVSAAKVTMTVTKITKGCSDNWFKLDMNRYKNAVVGMMPAEICTRLNDALSGEYNENGMFVTMFLGLLNLQLRAIRYENACQVIETMEAEVEKHRDGAEPNDDLTIMCIKL